MSATTSSASAPSEAAEELRLTEEQWRERLTPDQFRVLRQKGTEMAFTGALYDHKEQGRYRCAGCGQPLFDSGTKYDSGSGWPSFWDAVPGSVEVLSDHTHSMVRTEVVCSKCKGHLGHVFDDGPADKTGQRYCINSVSLTFEKE